MKRIGNWEASSIVKSFNYSVKPCGRWDEVQEVGRATSLYFPSESYTVSVSFTPTEHPGMTRIRSRNWRCEDEPNGIYARADAIKFYRKLVAAGFLPDGMKTAEEKEEEALIDNSRRCTHRPHLPQHGLIQQDSLSSNSIFLFL